MDALKDPPLVQHCGTCTKNDLSYRINEIANLNMYADDHQMYIVSSDMSIMCTNMEKEGNSALNWYKDN